MPLPTTTYTVLIADYVPADGGGVTLGLAEPFSGTAAEIVARCRGADRPTGYGARVARRSIEWGGEAHRALIDAAEAAGWYAPHAIVG